MTAEDTAATGAADTSADEATRTEAATDATQSTDAQGNTAADDTTDEAKGDTEAAEVPETYTFEMPEGMELDQGLLDKATPTFKELGLTNEQASKLVGIYAEHVKAQADGSAEAIEAWYAERRQAEIAEANEAGIAAIKADKEIGGANFEPVKARVVEAVGAIGTPELRQTFDKLGLANDPEIVRFIHRCIDYTPQDKGETPAGGGGATESEGDRMYRFADKPAKRQA
jgi:hypothetical protein